MDCEARSSTAADDRIVVVVVRRSRLNCGRSLLVTHQFGRIVVVLLRNGVVQLPTIDSAGGVNS